MLVISFMDAAHSRNVDILGDRMIEVHLGGGNP